MKNQTGIKLTVLAGLLLAAFSTSAYAGTSAVTFKDSSAGKIAYKTGIPQLVKMPFKIFVKAGDSMESAPSSSSYLSSEGVVVGEPYNLDAETTG